ncbi:MAG: hypothetical protein FJY76_03980, partial [Candidatus Aenigmarchaeota archaeon]|nr:hypothetical protein [Candidatus Aenigmarchaeota archaeon]
MRLLLVLLLLAAALPQTALALPDSIYVTVPNGTARCMTLVLPDDSGWMGRGDVEYSVSMVPESSRTWSDFSLQTTRRINENNSWQLPVCFTRRSNASCGERFTLTINSSVGTTRMITGGACESAFAGVSTAPAAAGQSVGSALNSNFGLFDLAFAEQGYHVQPGGIANVTALLSSYQSGASLHITLTSGTGISVSPAAHDVDFGSLGGQRQVAFQVQAPSTSGIYDLALAGSVAGCSTSACTITKHASLSVGGTLPARGGFSSQLFPASINTEQGKPVVFRLTIYNNEGARSFNISMLKPYGLETDFTETSLAVGAGAQNSIDFNITPTGMESSYEFSMHVRSGDVTKLATGYLNVNGMAAGAARGLEQARATGNQSAMAQATQAYNQFQSNP